MPSVRAPLLSKLGEDAALPIPAENEIAEDLPLLAKDLHMTRDSTLLNLVDSSCIPIAGTKRVTERGVCIDDLHVSDISQRSIVFHPKGGDASQNAGVKSSKNGEFIVKLGRVAAVTLPFHL